MTKKVRINVDMPVWMIALEKIQYVEGITINKLRKQTGLTHSSALKLSKMLRNRGFILMEGTKMRKNSKAERRFALKLTDKGKKMVEYINCIMRLDDELQKERL